MYCRAVKRPYLIQISTASIANTIAIGDKTTDHINAQNHDSISQMYLIAETTQRIPAPSSDVSIRHTGHGTFSSTAPELCGVLTICGTIIGIYDIIVIFVFLSFDAGIIAEPLSCRQ